MLGRLAALVGVLLVVAACSASCFRREPVRPVFPQGTTVRPISVGGLDRSYRVYVPAGLPASAPLVIMLHGGLGSAEDAETNYGWNELADSAKFVVAYPDGMAPTAPAGRGTQAVAAAVDPRARGSTTSASSPLWWVTSPATSASTLLASMRPASATAG